MSKFILEGKVSYFWAGQKALIADLFVVILVPVTSTGTSTSTSIIFYWVLVACPNLIQIGSLEEALASYKYDVPYCYCD